MNLIVLMAFLLTLKRIERFLTSREIMSQQINLQKITLDNSPAKKWVITDVVVVLRQDMTYTITSFAHEDPKNRIRTKGINGAIKSISGVADFFSMPLERDKVTCTVSIVPQYSTMDISITWSENKWDVSLAFPECSGGWISCICDASGGESFQSKY